MFKVAISSNLNGTNIAITADITINGPNGMYSSLFFFFLNISVIPTIAPSKNAIREIIIMVLHPKNNPSPPINFTSPKPIASFPAISPPTSVINKKIPAPAIIPSSISIAMLMFIIPSKNVYTKPTSNIVRFSLFGIIFSL